ncbi:hypothetical protein [Acinetobacter wuhouensis]|uniref:Uncharacterized protein n=1 Tax=Acinetobacter wuhouensis TaxID=1879050 RepID=A0A3G2T339_9GAMM|nr:hypothetical protein [Acinetobacter wuhouensis]AYO54382.1 hypothetical protein CDG68_12365 [Acinetobacter wuhouensis]
MYGLKKRSKDESGLIQGAGTGTSDDVKKNVPAGSYIMPADSTQQIGTNNLKNMGNPTPVNLSNGEFQMSPDQVHSVGVQALDAMKDQTHTPVDQPQLGFKPGQKPEMYFANGGEVGNEWLKQKAAPQTFAENMSRYTSNKSIADISKSSTLQTGQAISTQPKSIVSQSRPQIPTNQAQPSTPQTSGFGAFAKNMIAPEHDDGSWNAVGGLMNTATGLGKAGVGAAGGLMGGLAEGVRGLASWVADGDNSDSGNIVGPSLDFAGDGLKQAKLGIRQAFARSPSTQTETPTSTSQPALTANKTVATVTQPLKSNAVPSPLATTDVKTSVNTANTATQAPKADPFNLGSAQTNTQPQANPYAIQQKGNAFSYANPNAAAQARANGVPELQSSGVQKGVGVQGIKDFMARTPEMNLGMQGYGNIERRAQIPQRTVEQEAERQEIIRAASTPIKGARGLTANQIRTLSDMNQGDANRANDVYKTDANNDATIQREAMGQSAQNYRAELGEQGANSRLNANLNLDAQKFNASNDLANRQFSAEQLNNMPARMKQAYELNLLKQYEAAETAEERQSLTEKLGMVRGQQSQQGGSRVMAINGGETIDEKGNIIKNADVLINNQTGQRIDSAQSQGLPPNMVKQVGTSNGKPVYEDANGNRFVNG